jgi:hypothetical protein
MFIHYCSCQLLLMPGTVHVTTVRVNSFFMAWPSCDCFLCQYCSCSTFHANSFSCRGTAAEVYYIQYCSCWLFTTRGVLFMHTTVHGWGYCSRSYCSCRVTVHARVNSDWWRGVAPSSPKPLSLVNSDCWRGAAPSSPKPLSLYICIDRLVTSCS